MKKILSMVCAAAIAVATFGMTVCAAPSPTTEVPTAGSGTSNGVSVELETESADAYMDAWVANDAISDSTVTLLQQMVNNSISMSAALDQMFSDPASVTTTAGQTMDLSGFSMLIAPFDLHLTNGESAANVTATFTSRAVIGLSDANQVTVLHFNETTGAWEAITPDSVNYETGAITATFSSLSPVTVVYQPTAGDGGVAPKTSEGNMLAVYAVVAIAAAAAIVVINRKRHQA